MNQEKISRAVELQNRANDEIETYGEASDSTVNELMNIIDNMTPEEETMFAFTLMNIIDNMTPEEEDEFVAQYIKQNKSNNI